METHLGHISEDILWYTAKTQQNVYDFNCCRLCDV